MKRSGTDSAPSTPPPSSKKSSTNETTTGKLDPSLDWSISFSQVHTLRSLVEVVGNVLKTINFRIITKEGSSFLCVDTIDPGHVCMIQARLLCDDNDFEGEPEFCLESSSLSSYLKNASPQYSIEVTKRKGCDSLFMRCFEDSCNSHHMELEMKTLVSDHTTMELDVLDVKHTIEIDINVFRQTVRMAQSNNASSLLLRISTLKEGDLVQSAFEIVAEGDATYKQVFYSSTREEEGGVIRAVTDTNISSSSLAKQRETWTEVYRDTFSTQYLTNFLKSMDRQKITLKVAPDQPLLLHYPLGAEDSYICFVLAPKAD